MTEFMMTEHPSSSWNASTSTTGFLSFPLNTHNMSVWETNEPKLRKLGRYMDSVEVVSLVDRMRIVGDDNIFTLNRRYEANNITVAIANAVGVATLEAQYYKTGHAAVVVW